MVQNRNWWAAGNEWLCRKAAEHFTSWAASKSGARWRRNRRRSPYYCGYEQPEWMADARVALGRGDEEGFKYLKLVNL